MAGISYQGESATLFNHKPKPRLDYQGLLFCKPINVERREYIYSVREHAEITVRKAATASTSLNRLIGLSDLMQDLEEALGSEADTVSEGPHVKKDFPQEAPRGKRLVCET